MPSAALTLQAGAGFIPTGLGSVCFAGVEGGAFARIRQDVEELLDADTDRGGIPVEFSQDSYGYTWLLSRRSPDDVTALVNDLHAVNTRSRTAASARSCCARWSASGTPKGGRWRWSTSTSAARSTRSPRCGAAPRSATTSWSCRSGRLLGDDLRVEKDLSRWFPVWGAPGL